MKLLVDAQLPRRLSNWLITAGHDAIHTLDLPARNRTTDAQLCVIADADGRVMVTKDSDFVDSFIISRSPRKLLLISTGNISNDALLKLLASQLSEITNAFQQYVFVELTSTALIVHE